MQFQALYSQRKYQECHARLVQDEVFGVTSEQLVLRGLCERQMGRIRDSLIQFQRAREADPLDIRPRIEIARSLYMLGQFEECLQFVQNESNTSYEFAWFAGCCQQRQGRSEEALASLFRAYELYPNFETKQYIASVQQAAGDVQKARETLSDILEFSPENVDVLISLGLLHHSQGNFPASFDCFSRAVFVATRQMQSQAIQMVVQSYRSAFLGLGSLLIDEEPSAALQKLRVARSRDPVLWCNLSVLFQKLNRQPASLSCAQRAFALSQDEKSRYQLGHAYHAQGDFLKAFHVLTPFASSKNTRAKWLLGLCAAQLRETKLALVCLAAAGQDNFLAALAGLKVAFDARDFERCAEFSRLLKQNTSPSNEAMTDAKATVALVKREMTAMGRAATPRENSSASNLVADEPQAAALKKPAAATGLPPRPTEQKTEAEESVEEEEELSQEEVQTDEEPENAVDEARKQIVRQLEEQSQPIEKYSTEQRPEKLEGLTAVRRTRPQPKPTQ